MCNHPRTNCGVIRVWGCGGKGAHLKSVSSSVLLADYIAVVGPKQLEGAFDAIRHCTLWGDQTQFAKLDFHDGLTQGGLKHPLRSVCSWLPT